LGYGVIGNTDDSGSFVLGSSPGTPASKNILFSTNRRVALVEIIVPSEFLFWDYSWAGRSSMLAVLASLAR